MHTWRNLRRQISRPHRILALLFSVVVACGLFGWRARGSFDAYAATAFCDHDGTCHEKPDRPSPRTVFSAKSRMQHDDWWTAQADLNASAKSYAQLRTGKTTIPLILLGDSITESWLGTNLGAPVARAKGVPQVLTELLNKYSQMDPLILALSGDQTQHLLYRLQNGQLLPAYADDPKAVFVVLIGTNNLGAGELPSPAARGVLAIAEYLLDHTKGRIILLEVLPRGDTFRLARICPPRCKKSGGPFASWMPAIQMINSDIKEGVHQLGVRKGSTAERLKVLSCGAAFLSSFGNAVNASLMPDLLHPNAQGSKILGECFLAGANSL